MLTDAIIQKEPCQPVDDEIKIYLHHTATSATTFEWPIHILNNMHIPHQRRWLIYGNPIEHYFRGLYPHCHAIMPTIVNYGYLHKLIFHSYISNPINQFLFDNYGPTPEQPDTIELRNLHQFVIQQKPIWIFTRYHTLPQVAGVGTTQPTIFV